MSFFIGALEGTPLAEIFRIMESESYDDSGLPEITEAVTFFEMISFQKAAQTLLSKLEKEYDKRKADIFTSDIPHRMDPDFEIFVIKLEKLEKLQKDISDVWDLLWMDIENCTKQLRENMTTCAGFRIALRKDVKQRKTSVEDRFVNVMSNLGFTVSYYDGSKKRRIRR